MSFRSIAYCVCGATMQANGSELYRERWERFLADHYAQEGHEAATPAEARNARRRQERAEERRWLEEQRA